MSEETVRKKKKVYSERLSSFPTIGDSLPILPETGPLPRTNNQLPVLNSPTDVESVTELSFWELGNPNSVINKVTDRLKERMRELPPELISISAKELSRKRRTSIDDQLRIAFWDEYFVACDHGKLMRMGMVYGRVCGREHFYDIICDDRRLAYILKPPQDYMLKMRSLLNLGLERFDDILRLNLRKSDGSVNTRLVTEIIKIVAILDNRVKGAVPQKLKIDSTSTTKTLSVSVNQNYEAPKTHKDIVGELREIEQEIRRLQDPNSVAEPSQFVVGAEEPDGEPVKLSRGQVESGFGGPDSVFDPECEVIPGDE